MRIGNRNKMKKTMIFVDNRDRIKAEEIISYLKVIFGVKKKLSKKAYNEIVQEVEFMLNTD